MNTLYEYLESKENKFRQHSFFRNLKSVDSLSQLALVAAQLSFWVMSFQDLLRLNIEQVQDKKLSRLLRCHQTEDAGHEEWFLHDLAVMQIAEPRLRTLYSQTHTPTRDATYFVLAQVFEAQSDHERIALLLTIESAAQVFFSQVADFSERLKVSKDLMYFSNHHLNAEESHDSLDHDMENCLNRMWLTEDKKRIVYSLIDRVYHAFSILFDHFNATLVENLSVSV
ncbi:hypothetical protein XM38_025630 [Halomicronema hongdechloris C2206]|uniref:Iron-containing redox enzyme family protein n=1 Tax=Halomicronema hongdechloris C2206 TaxID=1641165 RepID=A0A1Z3HMV0_9CYAN|nr:hypothetical protein [Halomicronema hongdechloris]ASC71610.1 hypothetical protein XM38_025630 [Halomicronema hongdechloris C2206]